MKNTLHMFCLLLVWTCDSKLLEVQFYKCTFSYLQKIQNSRLIIFHLSCPKSTLPPRGKCPFNHFKNAPSFEDLRLRRVGFQHSWVGQFKWKLRLKTKDKNQVLSTKYQVLKTEFTNTTLTLTIRKTQTQTISDYEFWSQIAVLYYSLKHPAQACRLSKLKRHPGQSRAMRLESPGSKYVSAGWII